MNLFSKEMMVVAVGGGLGSLARFLLSRFTQALIPYAALPWGIMTVNVLGCFLIGLLYGVFEFKLLMHPLWRAGLMIGILGGFTTFSSFSIDTFYFLLRGEFFSAISNVFITVIIGLLATALGAWVMALFLTR
ncbi:MAG: fluoride efflux transporter CrcB [Gammaproteobacteria bacterium CG_4_10_14_0_8_um_filter_38_16]|nr:MAG: fluoride efflux transporter CrcB [Gammaproteobacteria bacterium CG_4_10_14_0_8_um_filter_38_16]PJA03029.1 MAG: fluoride efflux transporter CrcB [Gammaproteobacteria bacterium CG_4_10_14_0_2_um_filter_38_22]PJB10241.1 MAG: fluoride efflux transporter CrcB [Gammaproteobacteria bacterium CG_4_9_14_3_um_filter_38_9]